MISFGQPRFFWPYGTCMDSSCPCCVGYWMQVSFIYIVAVHGYQLQGVDFFLGPDGFICRAVSAIVCSMGVY